jgi:hypothetical protein
MAVNQAINLTPLASVGAARVKLIGVSLGAGYTYLRRYECHAEGDSISKHFARPGRVSINSVMLAQRIRPPETHTTFAPLKAKTTFLVWGPALRAG